MPLYQVDVDGQTVEFDSPVDLTPEQLEAEVSGFRSQLAPTAAPEEAPGYLSQLGTSLYQGGRQALGGARTAFNALTGDTADMAAGLQQQAEAQRALQEAQTPEDVAFLEDLNKQAEELKQARGFLPTLSEAIDLPMAALRQPGAAIKTAVQSLPNALISTPITLGAGVLGTAAGGLVGLPTTGPGAVATGIAGGIAAGVAANTALEAGSEIYQRFVERIGDPAGMTREQIAAALDQNPDIASEGLTTGLTRGAVIGTIETLGLKGAGALLAAPERAAIQATRQVLTRSGVDLADDAAVRAAMATPEMAKATKAAADAARAGFNVPARAVGAGAVEIGASGVGEALAQQAVGQETDYADVFLEMLGEGVAAAPSVLAARGVELAGTGIQAVRERVSEQVADNAKADARLDIDDLINNAGENAATQVNQAVDDAAKVVPAQVAPTPILVSEPTPITPVEPLPAVEAEAPAAVETQTQPEPQPRDEIQIAEAGGLPPVESQPLVQTPADEAPEGVALGGREGQEGQVIPEPVQPMEAAPAPIKASELEIGDTFQIGDRVYQLGSRLRDGRLRATQLDPTTFEPLPTPAGYAAGTGVVIPKNRNVNRVQRPLPAPQAEIVSPEGVTPPQPLPPTGGVPTESLPAGQPTSGDVGTALRAVATNTATPEQVASLEAQGLARTVQGQPVITDAGLALMPEAERPRLTEAERVAEIEGQGGVMASLRDMDAPYLDAVARGDMETAQRLVDEAAGFQAVTYISSRKTPNILEAIPSKLVDLIRGDVLPYVTGGDSVAINGVYDEGEIAYLTREEGRVFKRSGELRKLFAEDLARSSGDAYGVFEDRWPGVTPSDVAAFVESAETVTYDDNGNVIPLSQRFQPESPDIRLSVRNTPPANVQPSTRPLQGDQQRNETSARRRRGKAQVPASLRDRDGPPLPNIKVNANDGARAREIEDKQVPGAKDTWIGTAAEYLAEFPDQTAVNDRRVEAFYDPATDRAVILIDRVVARDGDAIRAARNGTSAAVEAVRRLIRHESFVHRGWRALPQNLKTEFLGIAESLVPEEEIEAIVAKGYSRYAGWRTDPAVRALVVEEWLAQRLETLEKLPATDGGPLSRLIDWAKRVWQWLNGNDAVEPTRAELVDVMRQMIRALEIGEKSREVANRGAMMASLTDTDAAYMDAVYRKIMAKYDGWKSTDVLAPKPGQMNPRPYSPIVKDLLIRKDSGEDIPESVIARAIDEHFQSKKVDPNNLNLPSQEKVLETINSQQRAEHEKTIQMGTPEPGTTITVRQDVPSYTKKGVGVTTTQIFKNKTKVGTLYLPSVRYTDPVFGTTRNKEKFARSIAKQESDKGPLIHIDGKWSGNQSVPADLENWTQVGFNPDRHSYYYEKGTNKQVFSGDEAFQVGNTVFVKNPKFEPPAGFQPSEFRFSLTDTDAAYMDALQGDNGNDNLTELLRAATEADRQGVLNDWIARNPQSAATLQQRVDEAAKAAGSYAPFAATKAAVSDTNTGAYHYGDGGIGRDTVLKRMSPSRGTGHFGTGTYFFGKRQPSTRGGRPEVFLELAGLNLAKPKSPEDLHSGLKGVNRIVLRGEAIDLKNASSDYSKTVSKLWFGLNFTISKEIISDIIEKVRLIFDSKNNDLLRTPSTYFMQLLGFDGIDVRDTDLDNGDYGSVIYPPLFDSYWYHGKSPDLITVFDISKAGANTGDGGGGVWLSSNLKTSETYRNFNGSKVPFYKLDNLDNIISELKSNNRYLAPEKNLDLAVDEDSDGDVYFNNRGKWEFVGNLSEPFSIQQGAKKFGFTFYTQSDLVLKSHVFSKNPLIIEENGRLKTKPWGDIVRFAKSRGHDAVIFANTVDTRGSFSRDFGNRFIGHSIVVFDSSQIKSADPVTYDDAGNIIPPSQRFQPESPDIRFSLAQEPGPPARIKMSSARPQDVKTLNGIKNLGDPVEQFSAFSTPGEYLSKDGSTIFNARIFGGSIWIESLFTLQDKRGKGYASKVLDDILNVADENGSKVSLSPKAFGDSGLTDTQLKNWYEKRGFVLNEQGIMVRQPSQPESPDIRFSLTDPTASNIIQDANQTTNEQQPTRSRPLSPETAPGRATEVLPTGEEVVERTQIDKTSMPRLEALAIKFVDSLGPVDTWPNKILNTAWWRANGGNMRDDFGQMVMAEALYRTGIGALQGNPTLVEVNDLISREYQTGATEAAKALASRSYVTTSERYGPMFAVQGMIDQRRRQQETVIDANVDVAAGVDAVNNADAQAQSDASAELDEELRLKDAIYELGLAARTPEIQTRIRRINDNVFRLGVLAQIREQLLSRVQASFVGLSRAAVEQQYASLSVEQIDAEIARLEREVADDVAAVESERQRVRAAPKPKGAAADPITQARTIIARLEADPKTKKTPKANPVRDLYREHLKNPMAEDEFMTRMAGIGVPAAEAQKLYGLAAVKIAATEAVKAQREAEGEVKKLSDAERFAERVINDAAERFADPALPIEENERKALPIRDLFNNHVQNGMTLEAFIPAAAQAGLDEATARRLHGAGLLVRDARQSIKAARTEARLDEVAANEAGRIIYETSKLHRQSGYINTASPAADTIRKAFTDQVKEPKPFEQFVERLKALRIEEDLATRLFNVADREHTARKAMALERKRQRAAKEDSPAVAFAKRTIDDVASRLADPALPQEERQRKVLAIRELYKEHVRDGLPFDVFISRAEAAGVEGAMASTLHGVGMMEREARETTRGYNEAQAGQRFAEKTINDAATLYADPALPQPVRNKRRVAAQELYNKHVKKAMDQAEFLEAARKAGVNEATAMVLFNVGNMTREAREAQAYGRRLIERRERLLDAEGSALENLINNLRGKITGDLSWREMFDRPLETQRQWRRDLFAALRNDPALAGLTPQEIGDLVVEIDKVWEAKRKKNFEAQLKRMNLPGAKGNSKDKIVKSAPKLLRYINSGFFNDAAFRNAISEEFGIPALNEETVKQVVDLMQRAQADGITEVERKGLMLEAIRLMQRDLKAEFGDILSNYWVTSVLSGFATQFDMAFSALNGMRVMAQSMADLAIRKLEFKLAGRAGMAYLRALGNVILEAARYFYTGDPKLLDNYQYTLNTYLTEGSAAANPFDYFERIIKDPNRPSWKKIMPYFYAGMQRAMTAFDHINSTATTQGMLEMAMFYNRELYEGARMPSKEDVAAARAKAVEMVGGDKTWGQKREVSSYTRQILNELLNKKYPGLLDEARDIGKVVSYTNDPTGIGGIVYHTLLGVTNKYINEAGEYRDKVRAQQEAASRTKRFMANLNYLTAANARNMTGLRFVRFVGNRLNEILSFTPGLGLLRLQEKGMTPTMRAMIIQNQTLGLSLSVLAGVTILRALTDEEDDEKRGFRISGSWSSLPPDKKNQLRASGRSPYAIELWDGKKWISFNYNAWPVASIIATAGNLNDQRLFNPEKWEEKDLEDKLLSAAWAGAFSFKDLSALSGFMDMIGKSAYSTDPVEGATQWISKFSSNYVGGFIPRMLKDIDLIMDPETRKARDFGAYFAKELPFYRRTEAAGEKLYNIFGEPVKLNRMPWRRAVTATREEPEYETLAELNRRGIFLGAANPSNRTVGSGATRRELTDAEAEKYMVETGKLYRDFIKQQGQSLLQLDRAQAEEVISKTTERLRAAALRMSIGATK